MADARIDALEKLVIGTPIREKFIFIDSPDITQYLLNNDFIPQTDEASVKFGYIGDYGGKIILERKRPLRIFYP